MNEYYTKGTDKAGTIYLYKHVVSGTKTKTIEYKGVKTVHGNDIFWSDENTVEMEPMTKEEYEKLTGVR